jgi:hypothetical protein
MLFVTNAAAKTLELRQFNGKDGSIEISLCHKVFAIVTN